MKKRHLLIAACFFLTAIYQPCILPVQAGEEISTYEAYAVQEGYRDYAGRSDSADLYIIQKSDRIKQLRKPSVAVALGGGGARALVNVGILK
ncbi:MAG TPA: hypothetical protein VIL66_08660, partial [Bacillota bacterium]